MTSDDSQIRDVLENGLGSLDVPGVIPESLLRRAKRRRIATSLASGALATTLFAGAVYGASTLTINEGADIAPAQSPRICSPEEVDVFTDISDPVGTGAGHYGVYFEVRITPHNMSCEPTLYIELDDSPKLPPDHEGPDADEFRQTDENPCLRTDSAAGDFLYSGKHTIEVGTGCDPDDPPPHETQETIRFDGKTNERIDHPETAIDPEKPCDLLSPEQVEGAIGTEVQGEREVESRAPGTRICVYETTAPWASVAVSLEDNVSPEDFDAEMARDPSNTEPVADVGDGAFIHACASITVHISGLSVTASVQHLTTCEETAIVLMNLGREIESSVRTATAP